MDEDDGLYSQPELVLEPPEYPDDQPQDITDVYTTKELL